MKIPCQSLSKEVLFVKDDTYIMLRVYLAISANLSACAVIDRYTCTKAAVVAVLANVSVAGSRYERRWLGLADTLAGFTGLLLVRVTGEEPARVCVCACF